jgi:hypothetical protein
MNISSSTCAKLLSRAIYPLIAAVVLAATGARAGLTLEMNLVRYNYGDNYYYYFSPNLGTNNTAPNIAYGNYFIASSGYPTNGSSEAYQFTTNGFNWLGGGGYGYGDYPSFIHELTNGNWSIFVTNSTTTNVYHFTVTTSITSNAIPKVVVTFPTNNAVNVTNQPTFTWQGPTNYSDIVVYEYNNSASLPVTQTSWVSPNVLYQGINNFTVHYDNYPTNVLVSSVPLDNASHPISSWVSTTHLQDYFDSQFTVGSVDTSGTSHILMAHYTWDGTNVDGTPSGADSSGNGFNLNFGGSYGTQGGANSTTTAQTGPRAIQFHDGDASSAGYVGWNPTPAGLLTALSGSFSVSCWIKTTQNNYGWDSAPAYYGAGIVSADNGGLANDVVPIALTGSKIGFNTGGDVEDVTLNSTASVNDGNYHHVVVTRNQLTGQKIIYIDGVLDSFSSGTTNLLNDPNLLTIGALSDARNSDASSSYYYNGYDGELDDLQIYSGALSAGEVANLYANPGSTVANGGGNTGGHKNVAHYTFDNSSNLGQDSSGNGNDMSGPTWWGPVYQFDTDAEAGGGAVQFFGTSELNANGQSLTDLNAVLTGSFTFSAWVKTTVTNGVDYNNAFYGAVIFWAYNDNGNTNDTIPLSITGNKAAFTTRDHLGNFDTLHSTTSVNDGNYHLITVTRNQATGEKKIYVDGNFETSEIGTTDPLNGNNYNLTLGGWAYILEENSTVTNFSSYNGLLDDVQIYTGVLSDSEVASLYANPGTTIPDVTGSGTGGLVVHYDFDEGTALAADVSGNNNNMANAGNFGGSGPSISPDSAAGAGSVSFDGGSYLTASPNLLATLASSFSISLWVNTTQDNGDPNDVAWTGDAIISADIPNPGANDLIPVALTGGQVAFNTANTQYNYDDTINSSATVNDGNWHHVVVSRNQPTGEKFIYIDGVLDTSDVDATNLLNDPQLLTIGCKADASNPDPTSPDYTGSNGYDGLVDDIQIYNRVLSSNEVAFLYSNPGATLTSTTNTPYPVDVSLQFSFIRSQDPNYGEIYGAGVSFSSVSPDPTTTNSVHSPNDYFVTETYPGGGWGSGAVLTSLDQVINEFTNGLWKIYINEGSPTQQVYSFQVSISGLDTNVLRAVKIFSPTNGAVDVRANVPFYWNGPTNFSSLSLDLAGVVSLLSLPVTATNWAAAPTLSNGGQFFDLNYNSNNFPGVTFTTPVDASANPVRTWSATVNLSSEAFSLFFVGPNPIQLTQPKLAGTNFQFTFLSQTGVTNSVQYRTNLVLGSWLTYSNVIGDGSLKTIPIPTSKFNGSKQGFIRMLLQ